MGARRGTISVRVIRLFVLTPLVGIAAAVGVLTLDSSEATLSLLVGAAVAGALAAGQERLRHQAPPRPGLVALVAVAMFVVETAALLLLLYAMFHDYDWQ